MRITKHALNRLLTKDELDLISDEAKFKLIAFDENDEKVIIENTLSESPPKEKTPLDSHSSSRSLLIEQPNLTKRISSEQ